MSDDLQPPTVLQGALPWLSRSFGSLLARHPNTTGINGDLDVNAGGSESSQSTYPNGSPMAGGNRLSRSVLPRKLNLLPLYADPQTTPSTSSETSSQSGSPPGYSGPPESPGKDVDSCRRSSTPATLENVKNPRPGVSDEVNNLVAVSSDEYERYSRDSKTEKYFWDEFMIDPIEIDFSRPEPQSEWKVHTHPEGALYFHNTSWEIPVLTDVYVYDRPSRERLETYIQGIFGYIEKHKLKLPLDTCLVLEFRLSGRCGYYFVDHTRQCLFWLDEFDAMVFLGPIPVKYTPSLVNLQMKSLYWMHTEYFPDVRPFPSRALSELKDMLIRAVGDSLTNPSTIAPYGLETLEKMLALVDKIESNKSPGPGCTTVICRFLYNFYRERLLHLHGERLARIDANQSIHPERHRTLLIKILSPLFLFGPEVHLQKFQEICVDSLVREHRWTSFLQELTDEWKEFTLYATVLLNANVAFLAIQSVDNSARPHSRSSMQRASYFSIITSIGVIVLALLLVWRQKFTSSTQSSFLANRSLSVLALETLALIYSLPYALLVWGFISFLLAFLLMCFDSHDILTIAMISTCGVVLLFLLYWTLSFMKSNRLFWPSEGIYLGIGRLKPPVLHHPDSKTSSIRHYSAESRDSTSVPRKEALKPPTTVDVPEFSDSDNGPTDENTRLVAVTADPKGTTATTILGTAAHADPDPYASGLPAQDRH